MEGNSYKSVSKQLHFFIKKDMCMKKQIQEIMKESKVMDNTNKHAYMHAVVNAVFIQIHAKIGIKLFGERAIAAMIKEFK